MIQKAMVGKVAGAVLMLGLVFALAVPADAARGFGGGGGVGMGGGGVRMGGGGVTMGAGGFSGTRGGFVAAGGFQGGRFHHGHSFHGHRCCVNSTFFTGFVFGSFPAPYYTYPYPYYWDAPYPYQYAPQLDVSLPTVQSQSQLDVGPSIPREACYVNGCYRLQGDGVTAAYQWIWVPAPPPPPAVIPYPTGRYELRGPSRWEWVPNSSSDLSLTPAAATPPSKKGEPSPAGVTFHGLFRWTDENGVTHWTQGLDAVPEQYRPKVRRGAGVEGTL
jgi:hypothetical protein